MTIEAITFDLDETLLSYRRTPQELLAVSFERVGCDQFFEVEAYIEIFDDYVDKADTVEEVRVRSFSHLARERGRDPALGRAVAEAYSDERDHANVELYPGTTKVLETCASDYDLALITNGPRQTQRIKLEATGIADRFETKVFAGDEAAAKPHPMPFQRALEALSVPTDRAIHVGNSLDADVRGAVDVGMDAVWVTNGSARETNLPDYRIDTIGDLLDLPPLNGRS